METVVIEEIEGLFTYLLETRLTPDCYSWISTRGAELRKDDNYAQLARVFAQVPRYASKDLLGRQDKAIHELCALIPGYNLGDWTVETLCRVWLLWQIPGADPQTYHRNIDALFNGAEMNEQVALYKALPLLRYPDMWQRRCEEGIRSNIGLVLEAIMYDNPYPAAALSEAAWNQMVLKAFFTDKNVNKIYGLYARLNPALQSTLMDYVQERLAANRSVNPELYELIEGA